jgi:hypothetical protein
VAHVGCVTVPAVGADGGCALTTIFDDTADVHPAALFVCKYTIGGY